MPSLLVTETGRAFSQFVTDRFTLADLRDADGSAVMVHAGPDNFANIPERYSSGGIPGPDATTLATGDAGARVACGVIW
jgi:Cu-Zn family superoxide dismutase